MVAQVLLLCLLRSPHWKEKEVIKVELVGMKMQLVFHYGAFLCPGPTPHCASPLLRAVCGKVRIPEEAPKDKPPRWNRRDRPCNIPMLLFQLAGPTRHLRFPSLPGHTPGCRCPERGGLVCCGGVPGPSAKSIMPCPMKAGECFITWETVVLCFKSFKAPSVLQGRAVGAALGSAALVLSACFFA